MIINKFRNQTVPLFSVIIPVHNKEPHISRSISSVLKQKFNNFELLIINDASTDNSLTEIYKFKDNRIRIFHRDKPGPGGYAARNLGIKNSIAEWIAFLDADDEWDIKHLEVLYSLIKKYPFVQMASTSWNIYYDGKCSVDFFRTKHNTENDFIIDFKYFLESTISGYQPFWTGVLTIKKNILLEAGGFPEKKTKRGGDVDTWLRVMHLIKCAAWSSEITATYFRDSVNMVTKKESFDGINDKNTIDKLISIEKDKQTVALLKQFTNKRSINRYVITTLTNINNEKGLLKCLYLSSLTPKQFLFVFFSYLPRPLFRLMISIFLFIKKYIFRDIKLRLIPDL